MFFNLPQYSLTPKTRIIIVESKKQMVGLLVDSVTDVTYLRASEIEKTPIANADDPSRFVYGVAHHNDALLILLDINKLLARG
jgi:purine-binding chemotaxis protein CheW